MGSYYGYWAFAAKAGYVNIDITLKGLALERDTTFAVGNAEEQVANLGTIDLLILDAEGP
jgi:hypothetical protein